MSMGMVERVREALLDHTPSWTGEHWDEDRRYTVREFLESTHLRDLINVIATDAARAAIEAMREPLPEMLPAMCKACEDAAIIDEADQRPFWASHWLNEAADSWRAGIDAALAPNPAP